MFVFRAFGLLTLGVILYIIYYIIILHYYIILLYIILLLLLYIILYSSIFPPLLLFFSSPISPSVPLYNPFPSFLYLPPLPSLPLFLPNLSPSSSFPSNLLPILSSSSPILIQSIRVGVYCWVLISPLLILFPCLSFTGILTPHKLTEWMVEVCRFY